MNLYALLEGCSDLLDSYGGHELAAGFTISEENLPAFRARVNDLARAYRAENPPDSSLTVDCVLPDTSLLTIKEVESLSLLEPYGVGNPKPVFCLSRCALAGMTQVGNGKHLKLRLDVNGNCVDGIFFSAGAYESELNGTDRADVCFYPTVNEYRGWRSIQLQLCDLRPAKTRAELEEELFRRLMAGEALTSAEASSLLPTRQEFANLWRYLYAHGKNTCIEDTARRLARNVARSYGIRETFMRTQVCLAVFHDCGLIRIEKTADHLRIHVSEQSEKVDLERAALMLRLRRLAAGN